MTPADIIRNVRRIEIQTRRLVTEAVSGAYHSSFKGRGMDFEEVREYSIGDDVRAIDWNVSARMDRPFIKVYREERELTLFLLIDLSASGLFGSVERSKRELAAEIASVLAYSATYNNDKVGLILYTETVEHYIPPKKGRRHILRLIRDILYHQPSQVGTNHKAPLDFLNRVQKRACVVFLVSDFLEHDSSHTVETSGAFNPVNLETPFLRALRSSAKRHDLIPIRLVDPAEETLPNVGLLTLEDSETEAIIEVDTTSHAVRTNYKIAAEERRNDWQAVMHRCRVDQMEASTASPYLPALRRLFAKRARCL